MWGKTHLSYSETFPCFVSVHHVKTLTDVVAATLFQTDPDATHEVNYMNFKLAVQTENYYFKPCKSLILNIAVSSIEGVHASVGFPILSSSAIQLQQKRKKKTLHGGKVSSVLWRGSVIFKKKQEIKVKNTFNTFELMHCLFKIWFKIWTCYSLSTRS